MTSDRPPNVGAAFMCGFLFGALFAMALQIFIEWAKPVSARRATVTICDANCTYTVSLANLNAAIAATSPGDTILLQAGAMSGSGVITIKTGVDTDGGVLRTIAAKIRK